MCAITPPPRTGTSTHEAYHRPPSVRSLLAGVTRRHKLLVLTQPPTSGPPLILIKIGPHASSVGSFLLRSWGGRVLDLHVTATQVDLLARQQHEAERRRRVSQPGLESPSSSVWSSWRCLNLQHSTTVSLLEPVPYSERVGGSGDGGTHEDLVVEVDDGEHDLGGDEDDDDPLQLVALLVVQDLTDSGGGADRERGVVVSVVRCYRAPLTLAVSPAAAALPVHLSGIGSTAAASAAAGAAASGDMVVLWVILLLL